MDESLPCRCFCLSFPKINKTIFINKQTSPGRWHLTSDGKSETVGQSHSPLEPQLQHLHAGILALLPSPTTCPSKQLKLPKGCLLLPSNKGVAGKAGLCSDVLDGARKREEHLLTAQQLP